MAPSWKQADVFPIISRLIIEAHTRSNDFVSAREIARRLLTNAEGRAAIDAARAGGSGQTPEWLATNMVSWFSQRITIGQSDWLDRFERMKIRRAWAYRPHTHTARTDGPSARRSAAAPMGEKMKALTIKQPWVHAILHEGKDIENRSWKRNFRGWLAIHAAGQPSRWAEFPRGHRLPDLRSLDYSAICAAARVVDIVSKSRSKWFWHPDDGSINYGWVLADVTPLKTPIPCKGALGLWDVPPKIVREIQRQLPKLKL